MNINVKDVIFLLKSVFFNNNEPLLWKTSGSYNLAIITFLYPVVIIFYSFTIRGR